MAFNPLGWKAVAFSEIEPFPCALLAHHYPDTPNWGDMTQFKDWPDEPIDLLCGGTPCQSFSVAGLRKGLADPRGNLMLTFGAIAAKYRPQWLVWENVPGVLSSNRGMDFGSFLGMLGQLGYGFAYRILDAQYFGVPQRRRRVFVVGCLGDWRSAAAVLFERHSLSGHPAPRRQAGQRFAASTAPSLTASGRGVERCGESRGQDPVIAVETLCIATGQAGAEIGADMAPKLNCNHEAPYIAHSLRGEGFDASEDGTGCGTPLVPVAFQSSQSGVRLDDVHATLDSNNGSRRHNGILSFDTTQITSAANCSNPQPGDPSHTLSKGMHAPAIAFDCKALGRNGFGIGEIASTQRAMGHSNSHTNGGGHQAVAYSTKLHNTTSNNAGKIFEERVACLDANSPSPALLTAMQVRRLTPEECEALQGFPHEYTAIPHRGKPAADGPRYKALGNSWAVPCARWIGERIEVVSRIQQERRTAA